MWNFPYYYSACPAGQYRSEDNKTCQLCPANTVTHQEAASECECWNGYFRYKADVNRPNVPGITWPSSDEGPSVGCSRKCHDITSNTVKNTICYLSPAVKYSLKLCECFQGIDDDIIVYLLCRAFQCST